ncbi:cytochrome c oxidase subunit II [Tuberibacillus calidus]|jgi:cytochrome c oxidase subunit 2|uniref:cytochrome c oxidase subunit II n=1 Tax=Tuberibacillus calidus TaxID=340097 RepID=UPI0004124E1E|nr:cytochrome c oxidase subunit II [Tuberibacillus calidus]
MKRSWLLLRFLPISGLVALLSGCGVKGVSALIPMGKEAREQAWLMYLSLGIMVIVILVVASIYFYVLIRFHKRKGQEDYIPKQTEGNKILEIVWTVIPILLLCIIAVPTVKQTFAQSDTDVPKSQKKDVLQVDVTAHQFWWDFKYPDQKIETAQDVVVPVGKTVIFKITSADVVHSFWVPALGGKIDANPGQTTKLKLTPENEGVYRGRCAELCGSSHALMYFNVKVVSQSEFDQWVDGMKKGPEAPATASAQEGQELFKQNCMSCHAVGKEGGPVAPNLTDFADRKMIAGTLDHNKENLIKWITNPDAVKPGANMPARGMNKNLTDEQIQKIADYLFTLSVK